MTGEAAQVTARAEALLKEAQAAPGSGTMADRLWATRRELLAAGVHLAPAGHQLVNELHDQWMRHRY